MKKTCFMSAMLAMTLTLTAQEVVPSVMVRMFPGRKDDVAWENESGIWRAYGPALQRSGEKAYGYDVWVKNTPSLVGAERFDMDSLGLVERRKLPGGAWGSPAADSIEHQTSFHYDHGNGLDCYSVGPSLGGGTPALLIDGKIQFPWCYRSYRILQNGPDVAEFELTYDTVQVAEDRVVEHRRIVVRKGTRFCECWVTYEGLTKPVEVCAGIVLHGHEETARMSLQGHYIAYADPSDRPEEPEVGQVMLGVYAPDMERAVMSQNHLLAVQTYHPGDSFHYWLGSGWSRGDCPSIEVMVGELSQLAH